MHYNLYYLFFKTKENSFRFLLITFIFYAIADKYVLPINTNKVSSSILFKCCIKKSILDLLIKLAPGWWVIDVFFLIWIFTIISDEWVW